jgi:hypothetical protein
MILGDPGILELLDVRVLLLSHVRTFRANCPGSPS